MIITVFEALQCHQARFIVRNIDSITQSTAQLLDCHCIAIRIEQNQVFRHEDAFDVVPGALIDGNTTVAIRVDLLRDLAVHHRVDVKHVGLFDRHHDRLDLLLLQLECGTQNTALVIINHSHVLLLVKELLHL